ncbi:MAG TPA: methyltransferase domain-containing protein [Methylomirabilota bacterium]|nr:methyltransferase domain-containing protein [Methylomirabilota bacterium]
MTALADLSADLSELTPGISALRPQLHQRPELEFEVVWTAMTLAEGPQGPGKVRYRGSMVLGLFLTVALASACQRTASGPQDSLRFPVPDRPVASIVSSAYSDEATRDTHGEAERVMDRVGIASGTRVADIGAGDGYYTVRLVRRLGFSGRIYATDVEAKYLKRLEERLHREAILGVTLVLGGPGDPRLPPGSIDVAILAHMYHEIARPYEFMYRLRAALAPQARIGIVEVDKPTRDHGTPAALLRCELGAVGYRLTALTLLAPADGYLAIFVPPDVLPSPDSIRPCRQ